MNKYAYDGPVFVFDKMVTAKWKGETYAPSESKARSNLGYQFKKKNNYISSSKITLTGDLKMIG